MVNYIPENEPFYPTDHCGVIRVKSDKINPKYLAWALQKEGERVRFSRTNRASIDSMRGLGYQVNNEGYVQKYFTLSGTAPDFGIKKTAVKAGAKITSKWLVYRATKRINGKLKLYIGKAKNTITQNQISKRVLEVAIAPTKTSLKQWLEIAKTVYFANKNNVSFSLNFFK